jgi:hypothetical protein
MPSPPAREIAAANAPPATPPIGAFTTGAARPNERDHSVDKAITDVCYWRVSRSDDDPVAVLQRWTDAGAIWRVIARRRDSVTVSLCTCDGGEEVDRFTSANPDLLRFVDVHSGE